MALMNNIKNDDLQGVSILATCSNGGDSANLKPEATTNDLNGLIP